MRIPIYKAEADIKDLLKTNVVVYCSAVSPATDEQQTKFKYDGTFGESHDFDLYPINSILVSTGWNKNDDIFDRAEVWAARTTPEDKPFNLGHDQRKIIGHITANYVVDDDLNKYDEFYDLPDKFHILTTAVIYKHPANSELCEESEKIIEAIQNGEKYVSMEAIFTDFDYGLISASGEHKIIRRCDNTSFLTKKLRIYGGNGEYNGCKIGRVLRNITFAGKGLVDKPANPDSVIFNDTKVFANFHSMGDDLMSKELEQKIEDLTKQLDAANTKIRELSEANAAEKDSVIDGLKNDIAERDKTIEQINADIKDSAEKLEQANSTIDELNKKLEEAEKAKSELEQKLQEMQTEALKSSRVSELVDCGVDKAAAIEVVDKYLDLDDDKFAGIVEMQKQLVSANTPSELQDDDVDKNGEDTADAADIDDVDDSDDVNPALAADDINSEDELLDSIAKHFEEVLK